MALYSTPGPAGDTVIDDDTLICAALRRYATGCGVAAYHAHSDIERTELRRRHDRALQLAGTYQATLRRAALTRTPT